jgi:hypothetical protein
MDRTAALVRRAAEVRRQIFASLPWSVRLAFVLTKFASAYTEEMGRLVGALFLQAGVEGMPDPGPKWNPKSTNINLAARSLPRGYMQEFMSNVYGLLIKSFHNPDLAEQAIQIYLAKLHTEKKLKPVPRSTAESYVRYGIMLEGKTLAREYLREKARTESLEDVEEDAKAISRDIEDPDSLKNFQHVMSPKMWQEWMDYLAKHIHPDMPLYLQLRMEGYTNDEIVGAPKKGKPDTLLPHYKEQGHPKPSDPSFWGDKYFRKVIPTSIEFFKKKREEAGRHPSEESESEFESLFKSV